MARTGRRGETGWSAILETLNACPRGSVTGGSSEGTQSLEDKDEETTACYTFRSSLPWYISLRHKQNRCQWPTSVLCLPINHARIVIFLPQLFPPYASHHSYSIRVSGLEFNLAASNTVSNPRSPPSGYPCICHRRTFASTTLLRSPILRILGKMDAVDFIPYSLLRNASLSEGPPYNAEDLQPVNGTLGAVTSNTAMSC